MKFNNFLKVSVTALCLAAVINIQAAISSVTFASSGGAGGLVTNVPTVLGPIVSNASTNYSGGAALTLLSATLTSPANNAASVTLYDAPGTFTWFTNSSYSNVLSYVTNMYIAWTNYYGATNYSGTNAMLYDVTNYVPGFSNAYPVMYIFTAPTNSTVQFLNLNTRFVRGILATNTSANNSTPTLSIQYTQ